MRYPTCPACVRIRVWAEMNEIRRRKMDERCSARVWERWRWRNCMNRAKKDGFCGIHHPDAVKKREERIKKKRAIRAKIDPWNLYRNASEKAAKYRSVLEKIVDAHKQGLVNCDAMREAEELLKQ
jgi:hypothetical protein